jgi:very-short-patch-repair endonuclease
MGYPIPRSLASTAEAQCGLFSAAQATKLGTSYSQLSRAACSGAVRRVRSGVYAMAGTPPSRWEPLVAAALAGGPSAVMSHSSAAALHGLYFAGAGSVPEITFIGPHRSRLSGVRAHRCTSLAPEDMVTRYGVLVTSPARTIVDLAGRASKPFLERMVDEALIARHLTVAELRGCLGRAAANKLGRQALDHLLLLRSEEPVADSALELRAYRALEPLQPFYAHFGLTLGRSVYVLDAAWPRHKVAAEVIGRSHRVASRSAFDRERRKFNALAGAGWQVAHLTAAMSDDEMRQAVIALLPQAASATYRSAWKVATVRARAFRHAGP